MDGETRFVLWLVVLVVITPLLVFGVKEYNEKTCRMELAKAGRNVEEIKELCK